MPCLLPQRKHGNVNIFFQFSLFYCICPSGGSLKRHFKWLLDFRETHSYCKVTYNLPSCGGIIKKCCLAYEYFTQSLDDIAPN